MTPDKRPLILTAFFCMFFLLPALPNHADATQFQRTLRRPEISLEEFATKLEPIQDIVEKEIREGKFPGAVVLVGTPKGVLYRRAFGYRSLQPRQLPMTEDTIFDVASLTKVVATTTAIMQLAEKGKLRLDAPVARYWPDFG